MFFLHLYIVLHLLVGCFSSTPVVVEVQLLDSPKVYTGSHMHINLEENNSGVIVIGGYNTIKIGINRATLKVVGSYNRGINLDENYSEVLVKGGYNTIKIGTNKGPLKVDGSYNQDINLEENYSDVTGIGTYNTFKIGVHRATLKVDGSYYKIRASSGNGHIYSTANYCCISIGLSMNKNQVTYSGSYAEVRRESYYSC